MKVAHSHRGAIVCMCKTQKWWKHFLQVLRESAQWRLCMFRPGQWQCTTRDVLTKHANPERVRRDGYSPKGALIMAEPAMSPQNGLACNTPVRYYFYSFYRTFCVG
jgi:hypothetical protein